MRAEPIETDRLLLRSFRPDEYLVIHRILDQAFGDGMQANDPEALHERQVWVQWSILNFEWMSKIYEAPYGDRAVVLKATGALIGSVGYVPLLQPFEQIPELASSPGASRFYVPEVGLFWVIDAAYQRRGYATEAARALIDHAFGDYHLKRLLATTDYSNVASQGVMLKLGMVLARNPLPDPPWMQVVGILNNPG